MTELRCSLCGQGGIDPDRDYRRVVGWERHRAQGGTNALALRQPLGEWAHRNCVDVTKAGIGIDQGTLL